MSRLIQGNLRFPDNSPIQGATIKFVANRFFISGVPTGSSITIVTNEVGYYSENVLEGSYHVYYKQATQDIFTHLFDITLNELLDGDGTPLGDPSTLEDLYGEVLPTAPQYEGCPSVPIPNGLSTTSAFTTIILSWDGISYSCHDYTEIWVNTTDDRDTSSLLDTSKSEIYSHAIGHGAEYYYWIRFVNKNGVEGDWNSTNGVLGTTVNSPGEVLDALQTEIQTSQLFNNLRSSINAHYFEPSPFPYIDGNSNYTRKDGSPLISGDVWIDSDTNQRHIWDTSQTPPDWVGIVDAELTDALVRLTETEAVADGGIQAFFEDVEPASASFGDLWIDTSVTPPTSLAIHRYESTSGDGSSTTPLGWRDAPSDALGLAYLQAYNTDNTVTNILTGVTSLDSATLGGVDLPTYITNQVDTGTSNMVHVYSGSNKDNQSGMDAGDLYIETIGGVTTAYRYVDEDTGWEEVQSNSSVTALQDLNDGKRAIYTTPDVPADSDSISDGAIHINDLWIPLEYAGTSYTNGEIYVCDRTTDGGGIRFIVATGYTQAISNAQATADGEIVGFFQPDTPTDASFGDIWIDTDYAHGCYVDDELDPEITQANCTAYNQEWKTPEISTDAIHRYQNASGGSQGDKNWASTPNNAVGAAYLHSYLLNAALADGTKIIDLTSSTIEEVSIQTYVSAEIDKEVVVYSGINHTTQTGMKINDIFIEKTTETSSAGVVVDVVNTYKYDGNSWEQISSNNNLTALADLTDGKRTIFSNASDDVPSGVTNDLWIPTTGTDDSTYPPQTVWQFNGTSWINATKYTDDTLAATKIKTYYQNSDPDSTVIDLVIGDMWVDITNSLNILHRWDGTEWVNVQDQQALKAITDIVDGTTDLSNAVIGTESITEYVSGQVTTATADMIHVYSGGNVDDQNGMIVGDLFIETNAQGEATSYEYNGSSWNEIRSSTNIQELADLTDNKRAIFTTSGIPADADVTNGVVQLNDLWIPPADIVIDFVTYYKGDIYVCTGVTSDEPPITIITFTKATKYTDLKEQLNELTVVVDDKIQTYAQDTVPYNNAVNINPNDDPAEYTQALTRENDLWLCTTATSMYTSGKYYKYTKESNENTPANDDFSWTELADITAGLSELVDNQRTIYGGDTAPLGTNTVPLRENDLWIPGSFCETHTVGELYTYTDTGWAIASKYSADILALSDRTIYTYYLPEVYTDNYGNDISYIAGDPVTWESGICTINGTVSDITTEVNCPYTTPSPETGDLWIVTDKDDEIRRYNGTTWGVVGVATLANVDTKITEQVGYCEFTNTETQVVTIASSYETKAACEAATNPDGTYAWNDMGAIGSVVRNTSTTVDEHTTTVQELTKSVDGTYGTYQVKIDSSGRISGFGLASEYNNGIPESQFIVNADTFAIAGPSYPTVISSLTQSGGTATLSQNWYDAHGIPEGTEHNIVISGATDAKYNGAHTATATDNTTLTFPIDPTAPATATAATGKIMKWTSGKIPFVVKSGGAEGSCYINGEYNSDYTTKAECEDEDGSLWLDPRTDIIGIDGSLVVNGTIGANEIQAGIIGAKHIGTGTITADKLTTDDIEAKTLKTANYDGNAGDGTSTQGWYIGENGNVEFNNGTFRGDLDAASGTLGTITSGVLQSEDGNFVIDLSNKTISITV